jgi:type IV pilus assembly protein PilQ
MQTPPPQPTYAGPLRLYEVRVSETAGQHSILFRFSRPPEGVDYFPLRSPSRLVIDVKGPIEALPKVRSYKAADTLVSGVRVGSYQGRMRLVVDLTAAEIPQFSVDNYETLLTAFLGEKNDSGKYAEHNAQVLFVANEARNGHGPQVVPAVDKVLTPQIKQDIQSGAADETAHREIVRTEVPAEKVTPPHPGLNTAKVGEPVTEEPNSSPAPPHPATATQENLVQTAKVEEEPIEKIVQVPDSARRSTPKTEERLAQRSVGEEPIPSAAPAGEFGTSADPAYTGRRISLDFKTADIHDVLRILADVSGLNIVATDDVKARVTLRLVEVPWDQA